MSSSRDVAIQSLEVQRYIKCAAYVSMVLVNVLCSGLMFLSLALSGFLILF